jgi:hypothetical protein
MPFDSLRVPTDGLHQECRTTRKPSKLRINKGSNEFELLNERTITIILSVRCAFVNHCESKTGFHQRHRLIASRDIHYPYDRAQWYVAPKQCARRQRRCVAQDPPRARDTSDPG